MLALNYADPKDALKALSQAANLLLLNLDAHADGLDAQVGVKAAKEAVRRTLAAILRAQTLKAQELEEDIQRAGGRGSDQARVIALAGDLEILEEGRIHG